jgi:iron complex outermembrane receptor protein
VRATLGANLFTEQASYGLSTSPPTRPPSFDHLFNTSDLTAGALFAQVEFDVAEKLTFVSGLRYDNEHRDFTVDYRRAPALGPFLAGRLSDEVFIPSLTVTYRMEPDVLFYAKASRGYQPPGFNFAPGPQATSINRFGAETLWAYETGVKTQLFDRRAAFNVAAFYYDYTGIQIRSTIGLGLTRVDNAASAAHQGVEASLSAKLPGGFSIGAQATYLHARYREFCQPISGGEPRSSDPLCAPGLADRSGNRLNLAPTWSGGVELTYAAQVGSASISAATAYDFSTSVFYVGAANEPVVSSGSWGKLRARIGFQLRKGPELFVYGRNLTDERFLEFAARVAPASIFEVINEPRTLGVGIGYRF